MHDLALIGHEKDNVPVLELQALGELRTHIIRAGIWRWATASRRVEF